MSKQKLEGISFFERYLSVWVIVCMGLGVLIGKFVPSIQSFLGKFKSLSELNMDTIYIKINYSHLLNYELYVKKK